MAAAAGIVLGVLGLLQGGAFGLLGVFTNNITPQKVDGGDSSVRIAVGLSGTNTGGDPPYIAAFNEETEFVGYYDGGGKIEQGSFSDLTINQHCGKGCHKGQQASYLQLFAGDDAICVAYIAQTWADDTKRAWLGDMGKACGMATYVSNIVVQLENNQVHRPLCTWLDRDHSEPNFEVGAIQLHMSSFSEVRKSDIPSKEKLCNAPITIAHYDAGRDDSILPKFWRSNTKLKRTSRSSRRSDRGSRSPGDSPFNGTLIASYHAQHNATALCANPMSWGPDFVSLDEGIFCDMTTRTTWPLCGNYIHFNCYDWNTHHLVEGNLQKRKMSYSDVIEWR
ncbi:hypothetical protein K469DRAFT_743711 [Zopfia rhizophila CBS 207.26]|uniref:Uncharacterized protein n=1 Tax=Zopfia rhizophila CBS 207.26 TaxID=1314779 RepID=A0A6A6EVI3_9PEZI|nr:hypothetical protein K469DRAFT_743711 [Zopfia rhizophila CBS 207.26]